MLKMVFSENCSILPCISGAEWSLLSKESLKAAAKGNSSTPFAFPCCRRSVLLQDRIAMTPVTILIVDDEQSFTEILAERLGKRGFATKTAEDGGTALRMLQEDGTIELVLLDIAMPGMSGIETLNEIKKNHPLIEVIMLTGHATVDTAVESIKLGAFNYLLKPCGIEDLLAHIQEAMKRKRDREARILEVRMTPYLSPEKRKEMIAAILEG